MDQISKPVVAVVGRPNVGKSTLFNRLMQRPHSIVSDVAGTTRDRVIIETAWEGHNYVLVDTGGLTSSPDTELWQQVKEHIHSAIVEADVLIMVVDANVGVTTDDEDVSHTLRLIGKPTVLAVNKSDNDVRKASTVEFYALGHGEPIAISAYHNLGIDDLMSQVIAHFPNVTYPPEPKTDLKLAIVGRTNVGKSMLLNTLSGLNRSIVSETPGTTRDALDTVMTYDGRSFLMIDTAGIRRSGKIQPGIERYSVVRSIRAIDRADVVVLLMDASELLTSQDTHIASYILDAYKGIILTVNKWDLAPKLGLSQGNVTEIIKNKFKFVDYAPVCFTSGLNGSGINQLLSTIQEVYQHWTQMLPRYALTRTVMDAVADHLPTTSGRRSLRVYSVAQDQVAPPSFTFYVNRSDMVHFSYRRYLENSIREVYEFKGSPLRMRFKGRNEKWKTM